MRDRREAATGALVDFLVSEATGTVGAGYGLRVLGRGARTRSRGEGTAYPQSLLGC